MTKHDIAELAATKAAPLFRLFGWTYGEADESPTHRQLVETVEELIDHCQPGHVVSTGRFTVSRSEDNDDPEIDVSLELYWGSEPRED